MTGAPRRSTGLADTQPAPSAYVAVSRSPGEATTVCVRAPPSLQEEKVRVRLAETDPEPRPAEHADCVVIETPAARP